MAHHFEKLRRQSGWSVEIVEQSKPTSGEMVKRAKRSLEDKRIDAILASRDIDLGDFLDLAAAVERGMHVSKDEKWQYERARLRYTYNTIVNENLIRRDSNGMLPRRIEDFRFLKIQLKVNFENARNPEFKHLDPGKLVRFKNPISLLAKLLNSTELVIGPSLEARASVNNLNLSYFSDICDKNKILIEESLQIELREDLKTNPVRQLNALLNLVGLKLIEKKRLKKKGKNLRFYNIDSLSLKIMNDLSNSFMTLDQLKNSFLA